MLWLPRSEAPRSSLADAVRASVLSNARQIELQKELDEKTWIVSKFKSSYIFMNANYVWKKALSDLGGEYSWLALAPTDVKLN